jgi:2-polyprenyl-3-methyl-5-hydroxy-6-metoxy-1,4-benzoquinol methylase
LRKLYAECYSKHRSDSDSQSIAIEGLIKRYRGDISQLSILDVGSGAGRLAIPLGAKSKRYVCIEADRITADYLEKKAKNSFVDLEIYNSRFEDLSNKGLGQFDLVILSHIIHWFDLEFLLQKSAHLLNPSGFILISYFDKKNLADMLFYRISGNEILNIQQNMTPSMTQIKSMLEAVGLELIENLDIPLHVSYENNRLVDIIQSSGTLAWLKACADLIPEQFKKIQNDALARLELYDDLNDTEYRTMLLATLKT